MTKKVKLVNVVQVMLFRRILPCQRRDFNLWEFDPARHQNLSRLFETKHEDAWKVLFKSSEVSPPVTEDRGFCAKRQASEVSLHLIPYGIPKFHSVTFMWDLNSRSFDRTGRGHPDSLTVWPLCPKAQ